MAIRDLFVFSEELRRVSEPVTEFNEALRGLTQDLFDTLYNCGGVALAAPQLHVFQRVAVIDFVEEKQFSGRTIQSRERYILVNPVISDAYGEQVNAEGCLSVPGGQYHCRVKRPQELVCKYQDLDGELHTIVAEGLLARAISHEHDHMEGKLYFDHISRLQRRMLLEKFHKKLNNRRKVV